MKQNPSVRRQRPQLHEHAAEDELPPQPISIGENGADFRVRQALSHHVPKIWPGQFARGRILL
jgi:hypothetical protein